MKLVENTKGLVLLIALVLIGLTIATAVSAYRRHQPTERDIPAATLGHEGAVSEGDKALDRTLNICRGC